MRAYLKQHVWWKVSLLYLLIGSILIGPLSHKAYSEEPAVYTALSSSEPRTYQKTILQGTPIRIVIPSVAIDLHVVPGDYNVQRQSWSVSDSAANYATNTYKPNDKEGTTLIYGHDRDALFHKIKSLTSGDKVIVYTKEGTVFIYRYEQNSSRDVQPNDTSIFSQLASSKPKLLLMTCDGFWSQTRRVMSFSFEGTSS